MVYPCECKVASVHSTCPGPLLIEALFSQHVGKGDCTQLLLYLLGLSSEDEDMCKSLEIVSGCKLPVNLPTYMVYQYLPFATFFSKTTSSWLNVCRDGKAHSKDLNVLSLCSLVISTMFLSIKYIP